MMTCQTERLTESTSLLFNPIDSLFSRTETKRFLLVYCFSRTLLLAGYCFSYILLLLCTSCFYHLVVGVTRFSCFSSAMVEARRVPSRIRITPDGTCEGQEKKSSDTLSDLCGASHNRHRPGPAVLDTRIVRRCQTLTVYSALYE